MFGQAATPKKKQKVHCANHISKEAEENAAVAMVNEERSGYFVLVASYRHNLPSFKAGIRFLMECAYVFNVHYHQNQMPVCAILERVWLKENITHLSNMADALLKKINLAN